METPRLEFKTISEVKKFIELNKTDTANYYVKLMKDDIKIIGKEQDVYYFDKTKKLWQCNTKEVYDGFMSDFLNETGKILIKSLKQFEDELDDEEYDKLKKSVKKRQSDFDSDGWISTIIKRSTGNCKTTHLS